MVPPGEWVGSTHEYNREYNREYNIQRVLADNIQRSLAEFHSPVCPRPPDTEGRNAGLRHCGIFDTSPRSRLVDLSPSEPAEAPSAASKASANAGEFRRLQPLLCLQCLSARPCAHTDSAGMAQGGVRSAFRFRRPSPAPPPSSAAAPQNQSQIICCGCGTLLYYPQVRASPPSSSTTQLTLPQGRRERALRSVQRRDAGAAGGDGDGAAGVRRVPDAAHVHPRRVERAVLRVQHAQPGYARCPPLYFAGLPAAHPLTRSVQPTRLRT